MFSLRKGMGLDGAMPMPGNQLANRYAAAVAHPQPANTIPSIAAHPVPLMRTLPVRPVAGLRNMAAPRPGQDMGFANPARNFAGFKPPAPPAAIHPAALGRQFGGGPSRIAPPAAPAGPKTSYTFHFHQPLIGRGL